MTDTNSSQSISDFESIKRYLYGESNDEERRRIEEQMFLDDDYFYEVANFENELVDLYARKQLRGDELARFERSLSNAPTRREKVANATAIGMFIEESREAQATAAEADSVAAITEQPSLWQRITNIFAVPSVTLQYGMAAMIILLTVTTGYFYLRYAEQQRELARLEANQTGLGEERQQRIRELETTIERINVRERELQQNVDDQRETTGEIADELERERRERERLERELQILRQQKNQNTPVRTPPQTATIATVLLTPTLTGTRGGNSADVKTLTLNRSVSRVVVTLAVPDNVPQEERLTAELNGNRIADDLKPAKNKTVRLTLPPQNLNAGSNELKLRDISQKTVGTYLVQVNK